ncbi:MAG: hypothetical protein F6K48_07240 [Okeania sp. SIO3H1]|nr:hypothetical protein [Okeania sp. SIO3H1]
MGRWGDENPPLTPPVEGNLGRWGDGNPPLTPPVEGNLGRWSDLILFNIEVSIEL